MLHDDDDDDERLDEFITGSTDLRQSATAHDATQQHARKTLLASLTNKATMRFKKLKEAVDSDDVLSAQRHCRMVREYIQLVFQYDPSPSNVDERRQLQDIMVHCNETKSQLPLPGTVSGKKRVKGNNVTLGEKTPRTARRDNPANKREDSDDARQPIQPVNISSQERFSWDHVVGHTDAKRTLQETAMLLRSEYRDLLEGIRAWRGVLLYGPPGTGKTLLAKAMASEMNSTFFSISASDILNKYVGESESRIKELFESARKSVPSVIFIDEVDSLGSSGSGEQSHEMRTVVTELLVQINGGVVQDNTNVLVMGATNRPWSIDPGLWRRFEKRVYIPLPNLEERANLFRYYLKNKTHNLKDPEDYIELAYKCDHYSGSDISTVVSDSVLNRVRLFKDESSRYRMAHSTDGKDVFEFLTDADAGDSQKEAEVFTLPDLNRRTSGSWKFAPPTITLKWICESIQNNKPSVNLRELKKFENWAQQHGGGG